MTHLILQSVSHDIMSMEDGVQEERNTSRIVRGMNTIRIPLYLCVVWIQYVLLTESAAAGDPFDVVNVLVPLVLMALDAIMVTWSRDRKIGVGLVGFILSCLSLAAALNSLVPYQISLLSFFYGIQTSLTLTDFLMIYLAAMVVLVSIVELVAILYESLKLPKKTLDSPYVIRTYET